MQRPCPKHPYILDVVARYQQVPKAAEMRVTLSGLVPAPHSAPLRSLTSLAIAFPLIRAPGRLDQGLQGVSSYLS